MMMTLITTMPIMTNMIMMVTVIRTMMMLVKNNDDDDTDISVFRSDSKSLNSSLSKYSPLQPISPGDSAGTSQGRHHR